jgi:hypothetical protein
MVLLVLAAVLLVVFVLQLARQPGGKVNLGDQEFSLGNDVVFAQTVAKRGPLIFAPLSGHITLYVQHLGIDPALGWLAFNAHVDGQPSDCFVKWRPATSDFVDQPALGVKGIQCAPLVFPADGTGLQHFATRVSSNQVVINLRQPIGTNPPASSTTATPTTATPTTTAATTTTAPVGLTTTAPG